MLVCVEAGLGLEAALTRVGMEMTQSHPLLAEQFGAVVLEFRAGRSREDAMRRMADRAEFDEIRAFATLLIQSTKLGSSFAQTLRIYASEMREKRRMRAEEKAHRLPVLLSVPLVACMLPTMIGVLMLPAAIRVVRTLFQCWGTSRMTAGGKQGAALVMLLASACSAGGGGKLAIKAIPQQVSTAPKPVVPASPRRADRSPSAMSGSRSMVSAWRFATTQRSADALTGHRQCYDQMGRYDLSRRYYEQALALRPTDKPVLAALAGSLDAQGKTTEAQSVRTEMAAAPQRIPQTGSITVDLPAPRPVISVAVAPAVTQAVAATGGPRLERLTLGEVALITTPQPRWKPVVVARTLASTTVRFVPLAPQPAIVRLRLLNAARQQGLAARTRLVLASRGWRDVVIGDADRVRERSLVLFSDATARRSRPILGPPLRLRHRGAMRGPDR